MGKIINIFAGLGLFAAGVLLFAAHKSDWTGILLCAGGAYILAATFMGLSSGGNAELRDAADLVQDPLGTIIDRSLDTFVSDDGPLPGKDGHASKLRRLMAAIDGDEAAHESVSFDADAAIARHVTARDAAPAPAQAVRTFGRKTA